jgi:N-acetylmuramoyl-L-alanine amidase
MRRNLIIHRTHLARSFMAVAMAAAILFGGVGGRSMVRAQTDPGFAIGEAVVVDSDLVNFRASATTSADVLAVLIDGTYGTVAAGPTTADGTVWYELTIDGTTGWSSVDYLQSASGAHGLIPAGTTAIVTTDALNLRDAPSLAGAVVATMVNGDLAAVNSGPTTAEGHDWCQLTAGGVTGWAVRDYLAFAPQAVSALAIGDVATVNTDTLNLRKDASLSANALLVLNGGASVTILAGPVVAEGWTWYQVDAGALSGWVAGEYLTN